MKMLITTLSLLAAGTALAQHEGEQQYPPPSAAGFIKRLDQDYNGRISPEEFDGAAEHFTHFDINSDGYIEECEVPADPPPRPGGKGFVTRLDTDGDGRISPEEFDGPPHAFLEFDRNGDGFIDDFEVPNGAPPGGRR